MQICLQIQQLNNSIQHVYEISRSSTRKSLKTRNRSIFGSLLGLAACSICHSCVMQLCTHVTDMLEMSSYSTNLWLPVYDMYNNIILCMHTCTSDNFDLQLWLLIIIYFHDSIK